MSGVQPIVSGGKVFVPTLHGKLHAIDAETGQDVWSFETGGPLLHAAAATEQKVFVGCADGKLYALQTADGKVAWTVPTGAAIWNAPAIVEQTVFVGSRDGKLYCVDANSGTNKWIALAGGPLLSSPAVDLKRGRVYIGCEDMRVYAFQMTDGQRLWISRKLPGVSLRGYHPVVAPDGSIMIATAPALSVDTFQNLLVEMAKAVFGDFASWRHSKEENARWREKNFEQLGKPETFPSELEWIRKRLTDQTAFQTFFVLEPETGHQKFVTPIVYSESMNGPGAPPLVSPEGKVIVKFQALLRSRYEHYSPFLNVGYLDTSTGRITPILDESRAYGWHDSLLLVHDEQCQLSLAGRILLNTHQDNVNALDLDTKRGFDAPFCTNIHEPQPGEAVNIWALLLAGKPLPPGKEWLARGTAVYGGGSVIDVPVAVAGDSFYYLPTHEINSGAAVIAYRMAKTPEAAPEKLPSAALGNETWERLQRMPWDWDILSFPRLNHLLKALPGKIPGTIQQPLSDSAAEAAGKVADETLDRVIFEPAIDASGRLRIFQSNAPAATIAGEPRPATGASVTTNNFDGLRKELLRGVKELTSTEWRPLVFPSGKHPEEAYRFFNDPSETLYTLALAYPHLDAVLKKEAEARVAALLNGTNQTGARFDSEYYPAQVGLVRSLYDAPPEKLMQVRENPSWPKLGRLYSAWLWGNVSGQWNELQPHWNDWKKWLGQKPNPFTEDCHNGYLAGLIGYCRLAKQFHDDQALHDGIAAARHALRERLVYELAHTRGGVITSIPVLRSTFGRWNRLTPDVAFFLNEFAGEIHRNLMQTYVDYHRPTWWLAWNVELMMRNEAPLIFPTVAQEIFCARAWLLGQNADQLKRFIDIPWCKADEAYLQKLAITLSAGM